VNLGDFYLAGIVLANLAIGEIESRNLNAADCYLEECIAIFSNLGMVKEYADGLMHRGIVSFYRENFLEAYSYYVDAVSLFERINEGVQISCEYYNLVEVLLKLNRSTEAVEWYKKGIASLNKANDPNLARMYEELRLQMYSSSPESSENKTV